MNTFENIINTIYISVISKVDGSLICGKPINLEDQKQLVVASYLLGKSEGEKIKKTRWEE